MNVKSLFILAPLFPVLFSCNGNQTDKKLFNGEIHYFDDKNVICKDVVSQHVPLDGIYTGMIAVYDSLLLCWDTKYPNYFINLFNIAKGIIHIPSTCKDVIIGILNIMVLDLCGRGGSASIEAVCACIDGCSTIFNRFLIQPLQNLLKMRLF